jgi:hypothetical protein
MGQQDDTNYQLINLELERGHANHEQQLQARTALKDKEEGDAHIEVRQMGGDCASKDLQARTAKHNHGQKEENTEKLCL